MSQKRSPLIPVAIVALLLGGLIGFFMGASSVKFGEELFNGIFEKEVKVNPSKSSRLIRSGFSLRYPEQWSIDKQADDYDPDNSFNIESPGSTVMLFRIFNAGIDRDEIHEEFVSSFKEIIKKSTVTSFSDWGEHEGIGTELRGRLFGVKTTARIFVMEYDETVVAAITQYPDEDYPLVVEGIRMVENSFDLK